MLPLFACLCLAVEFDPLTLCLTPAILLDPRRTLTLFPDSPPTISHRTIALLDWRMASQKFIRPMDQQTGTSASSKFCCLNCVKRADIPCDQSNEWNALDQRHLEYELLGWCVTLRWFLESLCTQSFASHSLRVARRTFGELAESVEADAKDLGNQTFRYEPNRWNLRRLL